MKPDSNMTKVIHQIRESGCQHNDSCWLYEWMQSGEHVFIFQIDFEEPGSESILRFSILIRNMLCVPSPQRMQDYAVRPSWATSSSVVYHTVTHTTEAIRNVTQFHQLSRILRLLNVMLSLMQGKVWNCEKSSANPALCSMFVVPSQWGTILRAVWT